jgi:diguanylate cyclase (GGDEF)-like protein/PAS domain S-box-containing protein
MGMPVEKHKAKEPGPRAGAIVAALFEDRLRDSELRYRLLADNCSDMIASLDLDGRYTYVSPAAYSLFGQSESELLGRKATDFAHPEEVSLLPDIIADILTRPVVRTLTFRRRCKDGSYRWVESRIQGVRDASGTVTQIVLVARDISERRRAEEDLLVAATAFETQEGMAVCGADGTILRVNRAFTEITGYTADDVVGEKPSLLKSGRHKPGFYRALWDQLLRTGTWQGEVWNRRKSGEVYPEWLTITAVKDVNGEITHFVGTFTDITQRKASERAVERLAFYDPLTRLPNRRLLRDRLAHALASATRSRRHGAVMFIDLDHFKTINDSLGHDKGDLLLLEAARRLTDCVRKSDTVARLGGDEFVVMLEDLGIDRNEAAAQTRAVAEKILAALRRPYHIGTDDWDSSGSIGATLFQGAADDLDALLKQADLAMYRSKSDGRDVLRFYDPAMEASVRARAAMVAELRHAIETEQFILHFQPQMDSLGRPTGAEALLRWLHPERGLIEPGAFIPLAEETTLILSLGLWILRAACRQLVAWSKRDETAGLTLSVNVSACQFRQSDFVAQVRHILDSSGADPTRLKLELTESTLLDDIADARNKMEAMRAMGLRFSLDDFGTGYSSLSYLKCLPLSQLKIDRSFVSDVHHDPNAAAIAKTIVFLAKNLGINVIAEGVETEMQRSFLDSNGCNDFQGYLFSRPLPLHEFENFLTTTVPRQPGNG